MRTPLLILAAICLLAAGPPPIPTQSGGVGTSTPPTSAQIPIGQSGGQAFWESITGCTLTAGGLLTCPLSTGANPTATAGPAAVNGTAPTFMRSDGAPAIQKASSSQFGIAECDNSTITCSGGIFVAVGGVATSITPGTTTVVGATAPCLIENSATTVMACAAVNAGALTALGSALNGSGGLLAFSKIGTSGSTIPLLNAANTWSGVQSFNDGDLSLNGSSSGASVLHAPATAGGVVTLPPGSVTLLTAPVITTYTSTTSGITFPENATQVRIILQGQGGCGGGGAGITTPFTGAGGGGGGGGGIKDTGWLPISSLSGTGTVTIGAQCTAAAGAGVGGTGANGSVGGWAVFAMTGLQTVTAYGGGGGAGAVGGSGATATGGGGGAGNGGFGTSSTNATGGAAGFVGGIAGGSGVNGAANPNPFAGGGGGGSSTAGVAGNGSPTTIGGSGGGAGGGGSTGTPTNGGAAYITFSGVNAAGGTAAGATGNPGSNGPAAFNAWAGSGGSGGAGGTSAGGNGGNGGAGGGGGGGGGSGIGASATGGNGGAGGAALVIVMTQ